MKRREILPIEKLTEIPKNWAGNLQSICVKTPKAKNRSEIMDGSELVGWWDDKILEPESGYDRKYSAERNQKWKFNINDGWRRSEEEAKAPKLLSDMNL